MSDMNNVKIEPHFNLSFGKKEDHTQRKNGSVGILNRGRNNKFINNRFSNLDVGIQDEGTSTVVEGNEFE